MIAAVYDRAELASSTRRKTDEGWLVAQAHLTKPGVYKYTRRELDLDGDPSELVGVLRGPEVVFDRATLASVQERPITMDHPKGPDGSEMVGPQNLRQVVVGQIGRNIKKVDGRFLSGDVVITDPAGVRDVETGRARQVSLGMRFNTEPKQGKFRGEAYDYIATGSLNINHAALVAVGRAGREVQVLDSEGGPMDKEQIDKVLKDRDDALMDQVKKLVETSDSAKLGDLEAKVDKLIEASTADGEAESSDAKTKDEDGVVTLDTLDKALKPISDRLEKLEVAAKDMGWGKKKTMDEKDGDEKSTSDAAPKEVSTLDAGLLLAVTPFIGEEKATEMSDAGASAKEMLVAAVGDAVENAAEQSEDYLRGQLDFMSKQRGDAKATLDSARNGNADNSLMVSQFSGSFLDKRRALRNRRSTRETLGDRRTA